MDILHNLQFLLMLLTAIAAGLSAGLYFTFSNFVMKALAQRPAVQGIAAMQAINITIINPGFMLIFFGTGIASIVLMILLILQPLNSSHFYWLGGTLLYLIGTLGVTMLRNVPIEQSTGDRRPRDGRGDPLVGKISHGLDFLESCPHNHRRDRDRITNLVSLLSAPFFLKQTLSTIRKTTQKPHDQALSILSCFWLAQS